MREARSALSASSRALTLILVVRTIPWAWVPFYHSYLSRRVPLPVSGVGGRGVLLPILVCVRDLRARWSGAHLACLPSLREVVPYLTDCQTYSEVW